MKPEHGEHEFVAVCEACGQPMDDTGSPPVCYGCGGCYEAPRECAICGLPERVDILSPDG